ncbi:lytic transglycosylase domain-containing protein [Helicobacter pylori]|uniref:lytic transglycosylase domain-containing protein n=1 Tax=Helicobacter pylori TaxID=210 RepID=UPI0013F41688|nr:lytic transglycosylase domain-containing protein [Helicobacter pylori]NHA48429.1 LysM peptidoglycan-binding domain-containing protein [Helicobacter pylori]WRE60201.1 transglycosylase SLT domain-containing protein [Helicobacter pylori]
MSKRMKCFSQKWLVFFVTHWLLLASLGHAKMAFESNIDTKALEAFGVNAGFLSQMPNALKKMNEEEEWKRLVKRFDVNYQFIPIIKNMLIEASVPQEFLFLAMAESKFSSRAYSRKKAVGIWQFMPSTAKELGLKVNHYIDERRDPIKSTQAAITYLKRLYKQTGEWYLVAMAYNYGLRKVQNAIKAAGTSDIKILLDEDKKYLPKETREYIRSILSLALKFNSLDNLKDKEYLLNRGARVSLVGVPFKRRTSLVQVAKNLNLSLETLKSYNHQFRYNILPSKDPTYTIYIPYEKLALFKQRQLKQNKNIQASPKSPFITHVVLPKETLSSIAKRYQVSISSIQLANNLKDSNIFIHQRLIIPTNKKLLATREF